MRLPVKLPDQPTLPCGTMMRPRKATVTVQYTGPDGLPTTREFANMYQAKAFFVQRVTAGDTPQLVSAKL